jgi:hypothetical protein
MKNVILENFKNFGFIRSKVPISLFNKIKKECLSNPKNKMTSFVTGPNVAQHFYMEKNKKEFNNYLAQVIKIYKDQDGYLNSVKILEKNSPIKLGAPWINYQKRYEFFPVHNHSGVLSYVLWVNIPYDVEKEIKGPNPYASCFEFFYSNILGEYTSFKIKVGKEDEGTLLIFPSPLSHCVYPFYTSKGTRISVSGNIFLT